jgi:DNA-binding GntR family transcriptional regulator
MMHQATVGEATAFYSAGFSTVESVVAERIRRAILSGELEPGTRMRQAELAERMSISITPIRTALRQLAAEGLLEIEPRRTVSVHQPTAVELAEIYEMRALLEPAAMKKAAKQISDADLAYLDEKVAQMDSASGVREWDIFNREFHAVLINASNSPRLSATLINLLSLATIGMRASGVLTENRIREANEEHRAMLAACRDRDPEAARAMTLKHLRSSLKLAEASAK